MPLCHPLPFDLVESIWWQTDFREFLSRKIHTATNTATHGHKLVVQEEEEEEEEEEAAVIPQLKSHFPQKSPIISGSFAENDLQLKTSYVYNRESELAATG